MINEQYLEALRNYKKAGGRDVYEHYLKNNKPVPDELQLFYDEVHDWVSKLPATDIIDTIRAMPEKLNTD